jgi:hypothetical protein
MGLCDSKPGDGMPNALPLFVVPGRGSPGLLWLIIACSNYPVLVSQILHCSHSFTASSVGSASHPRFSLPDIVIFVSPRLSKLKINCLFANSNSR